MEFLGNISELEQNKNITIKFSGLKIPSHTDVFFRAKQDEILQQYKTARIFLRETETDNWEHWFQTDDLEYQEVLKLEYMGRMFESALMYYNIIIDLSWTICYASAEYGLYENNIVIDMSDMMNIEDAYKALRKTENSVYNPNSEDNPFEYLKNVCPEFRDAINLIIDFWKSFSNTNVRILYNYIKHKGKPLYVELKKLYGPKLMGLIKGNERYPTDKRDIQKVISLKDAIIELKEFDDKVLFPYIKELLKLLEVAVDPSPIVF